MNALFTPKPKRHGAVVAGVGGSEVLTQRGWIQNACSTFQIFQISEIIELIGKTMYPFLSASFVCHTKSHKNTLKPVVVTWQIMTNFM